MLTSLAMFFSCCRIPSNSSTTCSGCTRRGLNARASATKQTYICTYISTYIQYNVHTSSPPTRHLHPLPLKIWIRHWHCAYVCVERACCPNPFLLTLSSSRSFLSFTSRWVNLFSGSFGKGCLQKHTSIVIRTLYNYRYRCTQLWLPATQHKHAPLSKHNNPSIYSLK